MFHYHLKIALKENSDEIPKEIRELAAKYDTYFIVDNIIFQTSEDLSQQDLEKKLDGIKLIGFEKAEVKKTRGI